MDISYSRKNDKRILAGNASILLCLAILTFGCWNEIEWYDFMAPLGTVITFVFLAITLLCYVDVKEALRDKEFYLMVIADVITLVNIFIVKSGIGAFFTVADVMLVMYLSDKIVMPRKWLMCTSVYIAFFYYYWTFDVKGYFKGYNTNYGGLVLITGFAFAMIVLFTAQKYLSSKGKVREAKCVYIPIVFMFFWGYNIISWYRARCALLGLVVILFMVILPKKIWNVKWLYWLLTLGSTVGAIVISIIYILLGSIKDVFTIQVFYKDILSGRDEIWGELWSAFLQKPLTGIGSSYVMKVEWMDGMFEVHNGLLDILIVHGIVVFSLVCFMLIRRLINVQYRATESVIGKVTLAGIIAMLVSSFMENFFIVPPFTLCFLILFVYIRSEFCNENWTSADIVGNKPHM